MYIGCCRMSGGISQRPQRNTQPSIVLDRNYLFLFYFPIDNSFDYYPAHSPVFPLKLQDNALKLSLERYEEVQLKKGLGLFVKHGPGQQIIAWARVLSDELRKGKVFRAINLSQAFIDQCREIQDSEKENQYPGSKAHSQQTTQPPLQKLKASQQNGNASKKRRTLDDSDCSSLLENEDFDNQERELIDEMAKQASECNDANLLELRGPLGLEDVNITEKDKLCKKCLEFTTSYQNKKVPF